MTTALSFENDDRLIRTQFSGRTLFEYVFRPGTDPEECPKPYFHPLRTLSGDIVSNLRPNDHPWHHGLSMTLTWVSGQNFWGGPTYRPEDGYKRRDNVGRQTHRAWTKCELERSTRLSLHEQLDWITRREELWLSEDRRIAVEVFPEEGWSLELDMELRNDWREPLEFGNYASVEGLTGSHYTGLFLRLARDFSASPVTTWLNSNGRTAVADIHGDPAEWIAVSSKSDGTLRNSTLVLVDHPENPGFPNLNFVRGEFPCMALPFQANTIFKLECGGSLRLRYKVLIMDGKQEAAAIEKCVRSWTQV